jgi:hypothetical protein
VRRPRGRGVSGGLAGQQRPCLPGTQHRPNSFQDVMAQRKLYSKGGASHAVIGVHEVEGGSAATLRGGGVERQDGEAKAVLDGSLENSALKVKSSRVSPGRCQEAGAAEKSDASTLTDLHAVVQGGQQGCSAGLGGMPAEGALCLLDGAHAILADHLELRLPQGVPLVMEASHCGSSRAPSGPSNGRNSAGLWRMASCREIWGVAFLRAGVRQAQQSICIVTQLGWADMGVADNLASPSNADTNLE